MMRPPDWEINHLHHQIFGYVINFLYIQKELDPLFNIVKIVKSFLQVSNLHLFLAGPSALPSEHPGYFPQSVENNQKT